MPKFPPIPRLSIVIPIGKDLAAFENTLVSVLENQPHGSEVIVAHDGHYDDPFDLCDEVAFVTSISNRLIDLIAAGASQSRGRFVHVLAEGVRATPGWTDDALEKFEHNDAGLVIPVIRYQRTDEIIAAGWSHSARSPCQPVAAGQRSVDPCDATGVSGVYLQASFWRRELIRSVCSAYAGEGGSVEASYLVSELVRQAGWRAVIAAECLLKSDAAKLPWLVPSFRLGRQLGAIERFFQGRGRAWSFARGVQSLLANVTRPSGCVQSLGQMAGSLLPDQTANEIHSSIVPRCEDRADLIIRHPSHAAWTPARAA